MYATHQQWLLHWGNDRAPAVVDGSAVDRQAVLERGLSAASAMINTAAAEGGRAIPLSGATLFPSSATLAQQVDDLLVLKCIVIASVFHLQVISDTERLQDARRECNAWLDELRSGGGLPAEPPKRFEEAIEWISQPGESAALTPEGFAAGRTVLL